MIKLTIYAETVADFQAQLAAALGLAGGAPFVPMTAGAANTKSTTATAGKGRTSPPAATAEAPAQSAAPKTSDAAAELRTAVGSTAIVVPPTEPVDDDPLGENKAELETAVTIDDTRALLIEIKNKFPQKPTLIAELVAKHGGGVKKVNEVQGAFLAGLYAAAKEALAGK